MRLNGITAMKCSVISYSSSLPILLLFVNTNCQKYFIILIHLKSICMSFFSMKVGTDVMCGSCFVCENDSIHTVLLIHSEAPSDFLNKTLLEWNPEKCKIIKI